MPSYTHYWDGATCQDNHAWEGQPLIHTAGNLFASKGVAVGDRIFVVNILRGELYLIGRFVVGAIVRSHEEAKRRLGYEPYRADQHLFAKNGTAALTRFDRKVPASITRHLQLHRSKGIQGLRFVSAEELDRQALRGVGRLTSESADMLDACLRKE